VNGETWALEANALTVRRDDRLVLDRVSLRVGAAEFVCLCGPNGGGKTTFLKAALGLLRPSSGTIRVLGRSPEEARPGVGYVPQRTAFDRDFPATVGELIVANLRGRWPMRLRAEERGAAHAALEQVGAAHLMDRSLSQLSGGETQRAFLARALVKQPSLLLLDEPTAAVDAQGRAEILDLLAGMAARHTVACLMVTHSRTTIDRLSDRVFYLNQTILGSGRPGDVFGPGSGEVHDHDAHAPFCEEG
jgi:ABC-type Mn2+/Zn2+ transport system ATPase subunit